MMNVLRAMFLTAAMGCGVFVAVHGQWEATLIDGNHGWGIQLPRAPLWAPPATPTYGDFRKRFSDERERFGFPAKETANMRIERSPCVVLMLFDLILYLWPLTMATGLFYLAGRGEKRDLILHTVLWAGVGICLSALLCVGLWLLLGGWGLPYPFFLGIIGLLAGICMGAATFKKDANNFH